jgi:hypothetical protein
MSDIPCSRQTDPVTAEPFPDVEAGIAETTRVIAALRDRWPEADNAESLEDTLRFLADMIAEGVPALWVPTAAHLLPYRAEAIKRAAADSEDGEE